MRIVLVHTRSNQFINTYDSRLSSFACDTRNMNKLFAQKVCMCLCVCVYKCGRELDKEKCKLIKYSSSYVNLMRLTFKSKQINK